MIVTLTPNPSVDRTIFVDALPPGTVVRATESFSEPSGKGVNVSLALHAHGTPTVAVLPLGGAVGAQLAGMLDGRGLPYRPVPVTGEVRANISLVQPDGTVTKINEGGPTLSGAEADRLASTALDAAAGARWLVACGSLPPGVSPDFYARLVGSAREQGLLVAVDTSGASLRAVLTAGPDLVKPNLDELAEVTGRTLRSFADVLAAATEVRDLGAAAVLASLGPDGALLLDGNGPLWGEAPSVPIVSTVGAGDAMLAGFLAAGGHGEKALAGGLAWASAAVQHHGTLFTTTGVPVSVAMTSTAPDRSLAGPG
ncbi:1-phosphofructokinase [Pseudonocardia spinosispora]|uniref:1-phosphofructokinase n=1 Tax=Pseudonocardia spinosispora TaxID=103441 RepID=UPI00041905B8|nr:1-phosphofructokinase [Pseudonocardia spinosispora]